MARILSVMFGDILMMEFFLWEVNPQKHKM